MTCRAVSGVGFQPFHFYLHNFYFNCFSRAEILSSKYEELRKVISEVRTKIDVRLSKLTKWVDSLTDNKVVAALKEVISVRPLSLLVNFFFASFFKSIFYLFRVER